MLKKDQLCERRMNAPGYLPHQAIISKAGNRIIILIDTADRYSKHVMNFPAFARHYEVVRNYPEEIPDAASVLKARNLLADQSRSGYTGFIQPK